MVTNSTASAGAYLVTEVPVSIGDITEGAFEDFTLKYYVPEGVTNLQTVVYATASDEGGQNHYYPARRDFYAYNEANQLTRVQGADGVLTSFSYNQTGALAQKTQGSDTTTMTYNGLDEPVRVEMPTATVDYYYDALGRRISRSDAATTANSHLERTKGGRT